MMGWKVVKWNIVDTVSGSVYGTLASLRTQPIRPIPKDGHSKSAITSEIIEIVPVMV